MKNKIIKIKCECPSEGILNPLMKSLYDPQTELPFVKHKPNKCKCENALQEYLREETKLMLCSNCKLMTDKPINKDKK